MNKSVLLDAISVLKSVSTRRELASARRELWDKYALAIVHAGSIEETRDYYVGLYMTAYVGGNNPPFLPRVVYDFATASVASAVSDSVVFYVGGTEHVREPLFRADSRKYGARRISPDLASLVNLNLATAYLASTRRPIRVVVTAHNSGNLHFRGYARTTTVVREDRKGWRA